jgi:hypothetical protein
MVSGSGIEGDKFTRLNQKRNSNKKAQHKTTTKIMVRQNSSFMKDRSMGSIKTPVKSNNPLGSGHKLRNSDLKDFCRESLNLDSSVKKQRKSKADRRSRSKTYLSP